ncbi:MAG: glycine cleavage system protein H [Bacteroidetes bacterium]|nr:glycine cleavage system protein H [Bacteroidota bacterium]
MFPWVYEFHWSFGHLIFLGLFFSVLVTVVVTVIQAMQKTRKATLLNNVEKIRWHEDFEDLPLEARICRHELTGEVKHRTCDNGFDCRTCRMHPQLQLKRKAEFLQNGDANVFGFFMPNDRMYHRGHTYVKQESERTFTIGMDDFGQRLIGNAENIELPEIGTRLKVNETACTIKKLGATLRILSPIDGEVIDRFYENGDWKIIVRSDNSSLATNHLLRDAEIRPWIMREMERLQIAFATNKVGATLADGGELVPDFHKHFPKADWDGILGHMFLEA